MVLPSVDVEAGGSRRASRRAGEVAVKVARNVMLKRFSTKMRLRLELHSTPSFSMSWMAALITSMVEKAASDEAHGTAWLDAP